MDQIQEQFQQTKNIKNSRMGRFHHSKKAHSEAGEGEEETERTISIYVKGKA